MGGIGAHMALYTEHLDLNQFVPQELQSKGFRSMMTDMDMDMSARKVSLCPFMKRNLQIIVTRRF